MAAKGAGVAPIELSVKVDLDNANDKVKSQLSNMTKQVAGFYATTGRAMGAIVGGAAIGTIAGLGAAMALTVGAASKFEDSFAGIKKTVNASEDEFRRLSVEIRELATNIPIATNQLNQIGELGGQLGVSTSGLPVFIDTIAKLGVATRLSTETAALSLARLQTIFQLPEQSVDNLASSLVDLGNNFAALEDEILSTALRLAAGAKVAGATVADTLAIATALQAVGVQSQAGGTAMARVFQAITIALQGGNKELTTFAQVTGMTTEQFKVLAKENPAQALNAFLMGLSEAGKSGRNVVEILEALGLKQQRTIRALLAVAEAGDLLTDTLNTANIAYDLNIALQEEANKRFETAKSQTKLMKNAFTELRIEMGNYFLPALKNILAGMTGLAESMTEAEKRADGLSKGTKIVVGTFATLGAGLGFIIPGLISLKIAALGAEMGMIAFVKTGEIAKTTLAQYTLTQRAAIAAGKVLAANIGLISAALAALTVGFIINQAANVKARRSAEAYNKSLSTLIPLTEKLRESEKRLQDLRSQKNIQGNIVRIGAETTAIKLAVAENEAYAESYEKISAATNKAFLNIPKYMPDLSLEETKEAVSDFDQFLAQRQPLDELMQQEQEGSIFYIAPPELSEEFAKEFDISVEDANEIISGGFDTIRSFLQAQTIIDEKAFSKGGRILDEYAQGVGAAFGQTKVFNTYTAAQKDLLLSNQEFIQGFEIGATRLKLIDGETEMILDGQTEMFEAYNKMREENSNLPEISEIEFFQDPEATLTVFKAINGMLDDVNDELEETVDIADDILNKFYDALDPLQAIKGTLEDFPSPEFVSIDDLDAANQKAQDLQNILNSGVFQLMEAGFPALALSFADGKLEAKNLGTLIAIINDGIENNTDMLQVRNDSLIDSSDDYADFAMLTEESLGKALDTLDSTYGITVGLLDAEEQRASVNRVLEDIQYKTKQEGVDYLSILKQILQDERNIANQKQELLDLQQEINDLEADLVYDNIVITNAKRDQVEKAEALAELNEVLAEFGREGVKTNVENLNLLQMELNISRMQDQLENKMDKRRQKSLRDKKKEIKFLELAVEQGVVEQLDLDAAREELSEMENPLTQKEIDILKLQKDIAKAEYDAAKARAEGLSPEVISAIENYNASLNITKEREEEIAGLQKDIEENTADLNIELAENAKKYQDIIDKYPGFKDKITEVASMIGIPDEMLTKSLDNMGTTVDKFINYVDFAKRYAEQNLNAGNFDPDKFVNPKDFDYGSWETSDAYRSMNYKASTLNSNKPFGPPKPDDLQTGPIMSQGNFTGNEPYINSSGNKVYPQPGVTVKRPTGGGFSAFIDNVVGGVKDFFAPDGPSYPQPHIKVKQPEGQQFPLYNPNESFVIKDLAKEYILNPIGKAASSINWNKVLDIQSTWMNNYTGGNVPVGRTSVVGEMGPEVIMSTPMGTSVFSNKTGGYGSGVNIENMNLNITGLPADPITARKVAINIRKELTKLEKEGNAGTGLRNR
jgi:TP901 family phage tail tape measure protein